MRKETCFSMTIMASLLFVMMIFGPPCAAGEPIMAIPLSDGSILNLTPEQVEELLSQPGVEYSEVAIPVPEELGGGYIIGTEEDILAALEEVAPLGMVAPMKPKTGETQTLTVTGAGTGQGVVTSSPKGIDCGAGGACSSAFKKGSKVNLMAKPSVGSVFDGWSGGGCSGTKKCQPVMDEDKTVTATFVLGASRIRVTPTSPKHFGTTKIGKKKSQVFTIKNEGPGILSIFQITLINENVTNQYSIPSAKDGCSNKNIDPKKHCKFQVDFMPTVTTPQPLRADVSIPSNDPNTPATIQLFGSGQL